MLKAYHLVDALKAKDGEPVTVLALFQAVRNRITMVEAHDRLRYELKHRRQRRHTPSAAESWTWEEKFLEGRWMRFREILHLAEKKGEIRCSKKGAKYDKVWWDPDCKPPDRRRKKV